MPNKYKEIIFQEVSGIWRRVDSREPNPQTLADYLKELEIIIDENTQFARIIQYNENIKRTIEYRAHGNKVRINIYDT